MLPVVTSPGATATSIPTMLAAWCQTRTSRGLRWMYLPDTNPMAAQSLRVCLEFERAGQVNQPGQRIARVDSSHTLSHHRAHQLPPLDGFRRARPNERDARNDRAGGDRREDQDERGGRGPMTTSELRDPIPRRWRAGEHGFAPEIAGEVGAELGHRCVAIRRRFRGCTRDDPFEIAAQATHQSTARRPSAMGDGVRAWSRETVSAGSSCEARPPRAPP